MKTQIHPSLATHWIAKLLVGITGLGILLCIGVIVKHFIM